MAQDRQTAIQGPSLLLSRLSVTPATLPGSDLAHGPLSTFRRKERRTTSPLVEHAAGGRPSPPPLGRGPGTSARGPAHFTEPGDVIPGGGRACRGSGGGRGAPN